MESTDEHILVSNAIYLNNLEIWISGVIFQDGLTDKQIAMKVIESFQRSMQANVDYHKTMANNSNSVQSKRQHNIMVEIYSKLRGSSLN